MITRLPARQPGFAAAYDQHLDRVYAFVGYRVGNRADAEDLTQQTFERALGAWERFDPARASVATWLLSIARNLIIDHYRRGASRAVVCLDDLGAREPSEVAQYDLGLDPALAPALNELGDRAREIIALRYGGDLAGPEIAAVTGLSLANVQQILSRSLRRLRVALEAGESDLGRTSRVPALPARAPAPARGRLAGVTV